MGFFSTYDDLDEHDAPRARKKSHACVCGTDLPGTCPGPTNCPYSGDDDADTDADNQDCDDD